MLFTVVRSGFVALGLAIGWYGIRPLAVVPKSSVPPSETQVTNTGSFVVCCGIADEISRGPYDSVHGITVPRFRVRDYRTATVRDQDPWFQAYLDGGVATRPFTLNGPPGTLDVVPSAKRFALDTESTVITVGGSETPLSASTVRRRADELEPVARWVRIIQDSGRGATSNVGSLPGEGILSRDTRKQQQNGSSWRVISSSPIAPRDGSRSHGSGGQCSPTVVALAFVAVRSEASPYDRLRYEPDYPSVTMTRRHRRHRDA